MGQPALMCNVSYLNENHILFSIQTLDPMHVRQGHNSFPNSHLALVIQPADTENN